MDENGEDEIDEEYDSEHEYSSYMKQPSNNPTYRVQAPQPDEVDLTKPFILNFDSMLPLIPERMSTLRQYFFQEALDKVIPQSDHKYTQEFFLNST